MIEVGRRSFITGFIALVAAPAIGRAGSLMPVRAYLIFDERDIAGLMARLDQRSNESDYGYAQRYGDPSDVMIRREIVSGRTLSPMGVPPWNVAANG